MGKGTSAAMKRRSFARHPDSDEDYSGREGGSPSDSIGHRSKRYVDGLECGPFVVPDSGPLLAPLLALHSVDQEESVAGE